MTKIIEKLAQLATDLDNAKLVKAANVVDGVNSGVLKLVKAQYEGVQGYWIRNQRCWSNCYRQKRQATNKPAQEVWFDCQREYEASLQKDNSEWDKYADQIPNLIKIASAEGKSLILAQQDRFHKEVFAKVEEGFDYASAVWETLQENNEFISNELTKQASRLAAVAKHAEKYKKTELAKQAAELSNELVKIAAFGTEFWNDGFA